MEYKYKQSNIFIIWAAYLFKSFYHISFWIKRLQKKFLPMGGSWLFFISPGQWIGNKQLFEVGLNYRSYKHFSNEVFKESLLKTIFQQTFVNNDYGFEKFCSITLKTLDKYALCKAKRARGNQMPFIAKDLSRNIMKRSQLYNKCLKNNNEENRKLYTKQRNYCISLLRKLICFKLHLQEN